MLITCIFPQGIQDYVKIIEKVQYLRFVLPIFMKYG